MKILTKIKDWIIEIFILAHFVLFCILLIIFCSDLEKEMRERTS